MAANYLAVYKKIIAAGEPSKSENTVAEAA
jgi:hypothetical protein